MALTKKRFEKFLKRARDTGAISAEQATELRRLFNEGVLSELDLPLDSDDTEITSAAIERAAKDLRKEGLII